MIPLLVALAGLIVLCLTLGGFVGWLLAGPHSYDKGWQERDEFERWRRG